MLKLRTTLPGIAAAWLSLMMTHADAGSISFNDEVVPVLTRFGCNSGGCHGKLAGQNGFRLSLRGFAPELDHETLTREALGRRINAAAPDQSLLIRKATNLTPHGGGRRLDPGGQAERVLIDWIASGAVGPDKLELGLLQLEVSPAIHTLAVGETRQLVVNAVYEDGHKRDVTWLTQFASSDSGALDVSPAGMVTALRHGETVIRASFRDQVEIATLTTPYETATDAQWYATRNNSIDDRVFDKLAALHIQPSPICDDVTFIRRASLDATGTLPTAAEVRAFMADNDPGKRARLIDDLLQRPEFIDFWALQLGDLLQNRKERDHDVQGAKGVRAMHQWLRSQLVAGTSWKDIATAVLTAHGSCQQNPAVGFYVVTVGEKDAEQSEVADSVAQAFLGTRIGCARCHNHPLEKYTQDDYYHFVSFFSRVTLDRKKPEEGGSDLVVGTRHMLNLQRELQNKRDELQVPQTLAGGGQTMDTAKIEELQKRIADLERQITENQNSAIEVSQPRTGQRLAPRPLDRSETSVPPGSDPRTALAVWITDPKNDQFSGAMVNRIWKHFLGVGLVEPVDDLRATNPPSNRPLWQALNQEFVAHNYDLRHLMRFIMNSRTYQLSPDTLVTNENEHDTRFYSHFYARRLPAEVLLDAICQATAEPEQFVGYPLGVRAIQIPDPGVDSYFLSLFGRSERTTACACERKADVTLPQLLHLQNSDELSRKLKSPEGTLAKLLSKDASDDQILDTMFLSTISRLPSDDQRASIRELLKSDQRQTVFTDVFWALLNSKEFTFNR